MHRQLELGVEAVAVGVGVGGEHMISPGSLHAARKWIIVEQGGVQVSGDRVAEFRRRRHGMVDPLLFPRQNAGIMEELVPLRRREIGVD